MNTENKMYPALSWEIKKYGIINPNAEMGIITNKDNLNI